MNLILIFLTALFTSLLTVAGVRKLALHYQIGALPSARKIHTAFVPVMGGLGIAAGLLAAMLLAGLTGLLPGEAWMTHRYFWFGLLVILVTGLIDDIRGLAPYQKFAGEFIAAGAAVLGGCYIEAFYSPTGGNLALGWFSYPFSVLWLVFIINAVNLLDGLDGLAGGISLITIAGFLLLTIFNEQVYLMYLALAMAVSELAGDSGSGLRWTQEDSIVVLLRAAATLAMTVPSATSRSAVGLIEQLGAAGQSATCDERPPTHSRSTVPPSPTMV